MTYTKQTWTTSSILNVTNLNKIESQYTEITTDLNTHDVTGHNIYYTKPEMQSYFWYDGNDGVDSGLNVDTIEDVEASAIMSGIQTGIMCWWNPENGAIPSGYQICDGTNGTYNMLNKYPLGAGTTFVGETTGNSFITPACSIIVSETTLTVAQTYHTHTYADESYAMNGYGLYSGNARGGMTTLYPESTSTGTGGSHNHTATFTGSPLYLDPIYRYLAIIQKV